LDRLRRSGGGLPHEFRRFESQWTKVYNNDEARIYWPKAAVFNRQWKSPAVQRVEK
jgi:hypothetical protein